MFFQRAAGLQLADSAPVVMVRQTVLSRYCLLRNSGLAKSCLLSCEHGFYTLYD